MALGSTSVTPDHVGIKTGTGEPEGYGQLATRWAAGLDVRLAHVVRTVRWSHDGVSVTSDHGDFQADRVVVTVPIGVLKSPELHIDPLLPEPLAGAIERLEPNHFEKVVLRFPDRFWDDGVYAIRRQGEAGRWWHSWYDLTDLHGVPTLLTFAAGPCADAIRTWDDDAAAASVLVTSWRDDPFAPGSYGYLAVGGSPDDHDILATPVGGVLHIAGEVTWSEDPATVTAALRSGHRAAETILGAPVAFSAQWT